MRYLCSQCHSVQTGESGSIQKCSICQQESTVPESISDPDAVIGDFAIIRELGKGGIGRVFLARQISLDRMVALKVLQDKHNSNEEFVNGFIREARVAAKISHPNIVQVFTVGEENNQYYFAMEYIDGSTMKQELLKDKKIEQRKAAKIIAEIANALDYAWGESQVVHQDIKPDNIMLTKRGVSKLADLGLARQATSENLFEDEDEVMGTPQYISPEQLIGQPTDNRSDIYSLGATFFHFVTGRFPYIGANSSEITHQHVDGNLTPPKEFFPELADELNTIICKMMARNLEDRYQSAAEVYADITSFLTGKSPAKTPNIKKLAMPKLKSNKDASQPIASKKETKEPPKISKPSVGAPPVIGKPKVSAPTPAIEPPKVSVPVVAPAPAVEPPKVSAPAVTMPPGVELPKVSAPVVVAVGTDEKTEEVLPKTELESNVDAKEEKEETALAKTPKPSIKLKMSPKSIKILLFSVVGVIAFVVVLAGGAYATLRFDLLPEEMQTDILGKLHLERVEGSLGLALIADDNRSEEVESEVAVTPSEEVKTEVVEVPKVVEKPKPVTRKEYIAGVENLMNSLRNQIKEDKFLDMADQFFAKYPQGPQTSEEREAVSKLVDPFGRIDERLRVAPARRELQRKEDEVIAAKRAELERIAQEQADLKAKQEQQAKDLQEKAAQIAKEAQQLKESEQAHLVEVTKICKAFKEELFVDFANNIQSYNIEAWTKQKQDIVAKINDVAVKTPAASDLRKKTADFANNLDKQFRSWEKIYAALDDSRGLERIVIELAGGRLLRVHKVENGVIYAHEGKKPVEISLARVPRIRQNFVDRFSKSFGFDPKLAGFVIALVNGTYMYTNPGTVPDQFWKGEISNMLKAYFKNLWDKSSPQERHRLRAKYGEVPEFKQVAK